MLSILLSPNHAYVYNIVVAFCHHLVKKKLHLEYLVSFMGRESRVDWKVGNFFFHVCLLIKRSMNVVCLLCS
jgi:hypothetical protein